MCEERMEEYGGQSLANYSDFMMFNSVLNLGNWYDSSTQKTAKWRFIQNDAFIYLSLKTWHVKTRKKKTTPVCKCFTWEEQNLYQLRTPTLLIAIKLHQPSPTGEMKQKSPIKISGKSGTPVYHHFTELSYQIVQELSESLTRRVCTLSAHLWDLNIEIIIAWSLVLCVRRVNVCV